MVNQTQINLRSRKQTSELTNHLQLKLHPKRISKSRMQKTRPVVIESGPLSVLKKHLEKTKSIPSLDNDSLWELSELTGLDVKSIENWYKTGKLNVRVVVIIM
ncbi:hypothetical protein BC833DRAFT_561498 [Globomyces pollinis-pini]|nr:hypothetical protein BC833DRAFT_561498 [Globomyces pollinis-pini]